MHKNDELIPKIGVITAVRQETADIKTFNVTALGGGVLFPHMPGQCAMLSVPGVGEAMFSISSSPTNTDFFEFSIKMAGVLTGWLHAADAGQQITVRGPYGNSFPVEADMLGKDLLFIAGGIGLAPLRSVINYVRANRGKYGSVDIVYGARSADDLAFRQEIENEWSGKNGVCVHLTIDRPQEDWNGNVGFVASFVKQLNFPPEKTALICGPPIMIKTVLQALRELGFDDARIYTTMELRMKCGVGKCGRCNIGNKYVCKDGPVFRCDELAGLPGEY
jgi:NAD(P)H-flavin reductase